MGTTVSGGQTLSLSSALADINVLGGGVLMVLSGGVAMATQVASGGGLVVVSGGTADAVTAGGYAASVTVSSGGAASGTVLQSGAILFVEGGSVSATVVQSGGEVYVDSGTVRGVVMPNAGQIDTYGLVSGVTAAVMGNVLVESGGTILDANLGYASILDISSGGVVSNAAVSGTLVSINIHSGGTLAGTVTLAPESLISVEVYDTTMPTAVISGFGGPDNIVLDSVPYSPADTVQYAAGTLTVSASGTSYALHLASSSLLSGGKFILLPGFFSGTQVEFQPTSSFVVSSGQTGSGDAVTAGNWLEVFAGGTSVAAVLTGSGPLMSYVTDPTDGGTLMLNGTPPALALEANLGIDSRGLIGNGGNLVNAGVALSATVTSGGVLFTGQGTIADTTVQPRGIVLEALFDASATHTVINGGLEGVAAGGSSFGSIINSGGEQVIAGRADVGGIPVPLLGGYASAATVNDGGAQFVNASGIASATRINSGGEMVVNSGGSADAPVIGEGGRLVVNAGATLTGALTFTGSDGVVAIGGTAMPAVTISGLAGNDAIHLKDVAAAGAVAGFDAATQALTVSAGGSAYALTLAGIAGGTRFQVTGDTASGLYLAETGATMTVPCYAEGTRLATPAGDVAVERLRAGDRVLAWRDGDWVARPVRWVGTVAIDLARHQRPEQAAPVRLRAHALAPGMPHRDLLVSPDHALFLDGALIQAQALLNGATVVQERPARVQYWHLELDDHAVLLAEGVPAESYLDTGNRGLFAGEAGLRALYPDLAGAVAWDERACAPLLLGGARVAAAHARVLARAVAVGWQRVDDAAPQVVADGRHLPLDPRGRAAVPAGTRCLRLVSRSFVPAWLGLSADRRRLGVAVRRLRFAGRAMHRRGDGWHEPERGWQWTNGDAILLPRPLDRTATLDLAMLPLGPLYWLPPARAPAATLRAEATA